MRFFYIISSKEEEEEAEIIDDSSYTDYIKVEYNNIEYFVPRRYITLDNDTYVIEKHFFLSERMRITESHDLQEEQGV